MGSGSNAAKACTIAALVLAAVAHCCAEAQADAPLPESIVPYKNALQQRLNGSATVVVVFYNPELPVR